MSRYKNGFLTNELLKVKLEMQEKGLLVNTTEDVINYFLIFYKENKDKLLKGLLKHKGL